MYSLQMLMLGGLPGVLGAHGQHAVEPVMGGLGSEDVPALAEFPALGPMFRNNSATHSPAQVCLQLMDYAK